MTCDHDYEQKMDSEGRTVATCRKCGEQVVSGLTMQTRVDVAVNQVLTDYFDLGDPVGGEVKGQIVAAVMAALKGGE